MRRGLHVEPPTGPPGKIPCVLGMVTNSVRSLDNMFLVGGLEHFLFSHILGIIIPIDSYFSEGFKPPTRFEYVLLY